MSNTIIQIRRSTTNTVPTTLNVGELAYSGNSQSNSLFIGHPDGTTGVIRIAGGKYPWLNNANTTTLGTLTANAVQITDANAFMTNVFTTSLFVGASVAAPGTPIITSITKTSNSTQLGTDSNTELATTWAIQNYVSQQAGSGTPVGGNTYVQFDNSGAFGGNVGFTYTSTTNVVTIGANGALQIGNATVNAVLNTTSVYIGGVSVGFSNGTAYTFSAVETFNANVVIVGNTTAELIVGGTAATANAVIANSTVLSVGNSTVNTQVNATTFSGTANNATNLNGQAASYYTNATNIATGTLPWAQAPSGTVNTSGAFTFAGVETFNANIALVGNTTAELLIGATAANIIANATTITLATNSTVSATVNSTVYSATANNATNFNGQAASFYANASNITTGTLPNAQLSGQVVNTSGSFTLAGVETFNANIALVGNTTAELLIGAAAANIVANSTAIVLSTNSVLSGTVNSVGATFGNSTVYVTVNTTIINTTGTIVAAGATISGNLNVTGSTNYVNTVNLQVQDNFVALAVNNSVTDITDMSWNGEANSVFLSFTGTLTNSNNYITATTPASPSGAGIAAGMIIAGPAVPANWTVSSVNATVIVMTGNFTGTTNAGASLNATALTYYGMGRIASNDTFIAYSTLTKPSGATITSPVLANVAFNGLGLSTALGVASGGTGLATFATGSVLTGNGAGAITALGVGANGNVLQIVNNLPAFGGIDGGAF